MHSVCRFIFIKEGTAIFQKSKREARLHFQDENEIVSFLREPSICRFKRRVSRSNLKKSTVFNAASTEVIRKIYRFEAASIEVNLESPPFYG